MPSDHETFWENDSFALIGHSAKKDFPKLSYAGLKKLGKKVFAVDPGADTIDGDKAYKDLTSLPEKVTAVIIEVPKSETAGWVGRAAEAGVKDVWIHMGCDTPEAVALAREKDINLRRGTCAVMYVTPGLSMHSPHRWIMKLIGKY